MNYHKAVLVNEVLHYLNPQPGGIYIDATFGGGGHTRAILEHEPTCHVIAMDWDLVAFEKNLLPIQEAFPGRVTSIWGNFAVMHRLLKKEKITAVNGILADFGTSQYQIKERGGFSFGKDTPLDMRMSPSHYKVTAADALNNLPEKELTEIFWILGQESHSRAIARAIVEERKRVPIKTTGQLVHVIERVKGKQRSKVHPATQVFQALRIYVNHELENIRAFLPAALQVVKPGGRVVCISFHSLEDRIVKQFFKQHEAEEPRVTVLTERVVIASKEEVKMNPSSRSAKLRAAERI